MSGYLNPNTQKDKRTRQKRARTNTQAFTNIHAQTHKVHKSTYTSNKHKQRLRTDKCLIIHTKDRETKVSDSCDMRMTS